MATLTLEPDRVIERTAEFREKFEKMDIPEGIHGLEPLATAILAEFIEKGMPTEVEVGRTVNPKLERKHELTRGMLAYAAARRSGNYGYELMGYDAEKSMRMHGPLGEIGPHEGFVLDAKHLPWQ